MRPTPIQPSPSADPRLTRRVIRRIGVIVAGYLVYVGLVFWLPGRPASADLSRVPAGDTSTAYQAGLTVWRSNNCQSCHSIYGLGGHTGPDLTNIAARLPAGNLINVIRKGGQVMPPSVLSDQEARDLIVYLRAINRTGVYPPTRWSFPVFGEQAQGRAAQE